MRGGGEGMVERMMMIIIVMIGCGKSGGVQMIVRGLRDMYNQ